MRIVQLREVLTRDDYYAGDMEGGLTQAETESASELGALEYGQLPIPICSAATNGNYEYIKRIFITAI